MLMPRLLRALQTNSKGLHQSGSRQSHSTASDGSDKGFLSNYLSLWKKYPVPIWAGLTVIGFVQYRRIRHAHDEALKEALESGRLCADPSVKSWKVKAYNSLPLEALSRSFGSLSTVELPVWARKLILGSYCKQFGVNLNEAVFPEVTDYNSLSALFRRRLKPGARPLEAKAKLTSPCDGRVLHCGPVDESGMVEQVKGMTYSLEEFVGCYLTENPSKTQPLYKPKKTTRLYQITMYLAPGDYHCFHSPADWQVKLRRHFAGKLLSVRPSVATWMPNLFSANERAVYLGHWNKDMFFSFAAVGATNVGSILISCDGDLATNCRNNMDKCKSKDWHFSPVQVSKGEHFGEFKLGSTVVLIFEAPTDGFEFSVKPGDKIKVGEKLSSFS